MLQHKLYAQLLFPSHCIRLPQSRISYDTYFWNGTTTKACKPNKSPIVDLTTSAGGHPSHPAVGMNNTFSCSQTNEGAAACPHGYQDELFIARVLEVLTNASRTPETPFFLFYAPHAPHDPYEVPQVRVLVA